MLNLSGIVSQQTILTKSTQREKRSEAVLGVTCGLRLCPMSHRFKKPLRGSHAACAFVPLRLLSKKAPCFQGGVLLTGILTVCFSAISTLPAKSQILPEVWATVGSADDSVSYGAGARFAGAGIEIGAGDDGSTGADFLTFISLPIVSPYLGIGYYSNDENIAYSGGLHLNVGRRLTIGGGYHSVRGPNGKLGFRF